MPRAADILKSMRPLCSILLSDYSGLGLHFTDNDFKLLILNLSKKRRWKAAKISMFLLRERPCQGRWAVQHDKQVPRALDILKKYEASVFNFTW